IWVNRRYAPMYPPPAGSFAAKWGASPPTVGRLRRHMSIYILEAKRALYTNLKPKTQIYLPGILHTNYCIFSTETETILKI
ncbi:hypothetical protein NQ317_002000, partial [Molorchus minor]